MELNIQLMKKTKKELEDLAKLYGIKGTYKLNKQALCDSLIPFIVERSIQIIQMFDKEQKSIFEQLLEEECTLKEIENNTQYLFLDDIGFLTTPRTIKQGDSIVLAKEIKKNYVTYINNIHKQEDLANKQLYYQKLSKYKSAMVNLYGTLSIEDFRTMYEKYEQETLDIFTLENWLQIDSYLHPNIIIKDRYLVHESLWMVDIQDFYHLLSVTKDKEYYIPSKAQLLCYHDENYFEPTGYTQTLKQYLENVYEISEDVAIDAIWTLIAIYQTEIIQTPELLTTILDQWIEMGIIIEEVEEVKQMMPLILNVTNYTRMWIHKGFTPAEIQKNKVAFSKEKVGRNEPCPCGSGKKYKKCCGK